MSPAPRRAVGRSLAGHGLRRLHGHPRRGQHRLGRDALSGLTVAVQGLGHVGYHLCRYLAGDGAELIVTDINQDAIDRGRREFGARRGRAGRDLRVEADVFAPCALGAVINDETLESSRPDRRRLGQQPARRAAPRRDLQQRGVLYAPDYVINAGGVIDISHEGRSYDKAKAFAHVAAIHDTLLEIFQRAEADGRPTCEAADRIAEERFRDPEPSNSAAA